MHARALFVIALLVGTATAINVTATRGRNTPSPYDTETGTETISAPLRAGPSRTVQRPVPPPSNATPAPPTPMPPTPVPPTPVPRTPQPGAVAHTKRMTASPTKDEWITDTETLTRPVVAPPKVSKTRAPPSTPTPAPTTARPPRIAQTRTKSRAAAGPGGAGTMTPTVDNDDMTESSTLHGGASGYTPAPTGNTPAPRTAVPGRVPSATAEHDDERDDSASETVARPSTNGPPAGPTRTVAVQPSPAPTPAPMTPVPNTPQPATTPQPPAATQAREVEGTLRIGGNHFGQILQNPAQKQALKTEVQRSLAAALSLPQNLITVNELTVGSLIVNYTVAAAAGVTAATVQAALAPQPAGTAAPGSTLAPASTAVGLSLAGIQALYQNFTGTNETLVTLSASAVDVVVPTPAPPPSSDHIGSCRGGCVVGAVVGLVIVVALLAVAVVKLLSRRSPPHAPPPISGVLAPPSPPADYRPPPVPVMDDPLSFLEAADIELQVVRAVPPPNNPLGNTTVVNPRNIPDAAV